VVIFKVLGFGTGPSSRTLPRIDPAMAGSAGEAATGGCAGLGVLPVVSALCPQPGSTSNSPSMLANPAQRRTIVRAILFL